MIIYPRIKFMRNANGKIMDTVSVVVEDTENEEITAWYSLKELRQIFKDQKEEEQD